MNILDPRFKYVSAANTDLRKSFAEYRRKQAKAQAVQTSQAKADTARVSMIFATRNAAAGRDIHLMRK